MSKYKSPIDLPDEHMRLVGIIAAHWEFVELILERAVAEVMEHDWKRVRLLTVNIGFRSKCELIMLHARPFQDTDRPAWKEFTSTIKSLKDAYTKRNKYVHGKWRADEKCSDPSLSIVRTAGGQLAAGEETVPVTELESAAKQIHDAAEGLIGLLQRYGVLVP